MRGKEYGGQLRLRRSPTEIQAIRTLTELEGPSVQTWIVRQLRHVARAPHEAAGEKIAWCQLMPGKRGQVRLRK